MLPINVSLFYPYFWMPGIVWPPRWACRFGSQAWWTVARCCQMLSVGTQSLTQIDADIMTLDSYLRPGYLLEMGGFLMKFESALFVIAIWDWRFLNLCDNFGYFFVLDVGCVGIRLSQCRLRQAIILQDAASEPSESLDSFAITWKVTRLNDIFAQPLGVTPDWWTPWNARGGELDDIEAWVKTAVDGGTRFAHGTCFLYRSFLATWWCYNVVCLGMQAIASLYVGVYSIQWMI